MVFNMRYYLIIFNDLKRLNKFDRLEIFAILRNGKSMRKSLHTFQSYEMI